MGDSWLPNSYYDAPPRVWKYDAAFNGLIVFNQVTGSKQLWQLPEPAWKMAVKRLCAVILHGLS